MDVTWTLHGRLHGNESGPSQQATHVPATHTCELTLVSMHTLYTRTQSHVHRAHDGKLGLCTAGVLR